MTEVTSRTLCGSCEGDVSVNVKVNDKGDTSSEGE